MFSLTYSPLVPAWLAALIAALLAAAALAGAAVMLRRGVGTRWVAILTGLRLAAVLVFALILLQPAMSLTKAKPVGAKALVLVDVSQSMGGMSSGQPRDAWVKTLAVLQGSQFASALGERYDLAWYAFDRTAKVLENSRVHELKPGGNTTRVAQSLAAACTHALATDARPMRVLLVSDGQDQSGEDAAAIARQFQVKVDVLPPAVFAPSADASLHIAHVQGAKRVLLGSDTHFRVRFARVAASGEMAGTLVVGEGGREILQHEVRLATGQHEASLAVTHRPATQGLKRYEFELRLAGARSGQGEPYRHQVHVLDDKHEVIVLEDTWRWEYRYLHRVLEDDPSFRFTAFLARGGGSYLQLGSPDRQVDLIGLPQNAGDLAAFDILVLGDIDPSRLSDELVAALHAAVAEEGKSLIVIAGSKLGRIANHSTLHELLPVELTVQSGEPLAGPIEVQIPAEASQSPLFFQFESNAAELPPLDQIYPVTRRRPGATVLLEAVSERNAYGPRIVMAEQPLGRGRVLFLAADTLWKWHTLAADRPGPTPYVQFWQQALRALAPTRSQAGGGVLWLAADRSRAEVGERVTLHAELQSPAANAAQELRATATLPSGQRVLIVFQPDVATPGRWSATLTPTAVGLCQVHASLGGSSQTITAETAIEVESARGETPAGVNLAALTRLAAATGGKVIDPDAPETWPREDQPPRMENITRTYSLWDNFSLLVALSLLLGAGWLIRALRGLV